MVVCRSGQDAENPGLREVPRPHRTTETTISGGSSTTFEARPTGDGQGRGPHTNPRGHPTRPAMRHTRSPTVLIGSLHRTAVLASARAQLVDSTLSRRMAADPCRSQYVPGENDARSTGAGQQSPIPPG